MTALSCWPVVEAWAHAHTYLRSHAVRQSFNDFVSNVLPRIMVETQHFTGGSKRVRLSNTVSFGDTNGPPSRCRLLDETYAVDVLGEIVDDATNETIEKVKLFRIPIMVGSIVCDTFNKSTPERHAMGECVKDDGGYFIIEGKEKAVACTQLLSDTAIVFKSVQTGVGSGIFVHTASAFSSQCTLTCDQRGLLTVYPPAMPRMRRMGTQIVTAMRCFGPATDKAIVDAVVATSSGSLTREIVLHHLAPTLRMCSQDGPAQSGALLRVQTIWGTGPEGAVRLVRSLIPEAHDDVERCATLAYILAQLITYIELGQSGPLRDSYLNKRLKMPGMFMREIVQSAWLQHVSVVQSELTSASAASGSVSLSRRLFTSDVEAAAVRSFRSSSQDSPVFEVPRLTMQGAMSYVSRVVTPLVGAAIDQRPPHQVQGSQLGFICPVETPEGKQVGLVNSLAVTAVVSGNAEQVAHTAVRTWLVNNKVSRAPNSEARFAVLLNGTFLGFVASPSKLRKQFKLARRQGHIHQHATVAWLTGTPVSIQTDGGRLLRPLIIAESLRDLGTSFPVTWDECLCSRNGASPLIEYVDPSEAACLLIASGPGELSSQHTHVEMHPSTMLSPVAALTPFAHRNQAPRNIFSCKQTKQCASVYASSYRSRFDTESHLLHYGQRPIMDTAWGRLSGANQLPYGVNVIVALATFTGYNQEDAVMLNESALQRGLFSSTHIHTIVADENASDGGVFCNPSMRQVDVRATSLADLEPNGLPRLGARVKAGHAIIGHVSPGRNVGDGLKDTSTLCDLVTHGTVQHAIMFNKGGTAGRRVKVCLYEPRHPTVGDKFSSRHGQKGVCGRLVTGHEMPFTSDGLVPDMVINPHALPSRMTVAQLMESICVKAACFDGGFCDGTVACNPAFDAICDRLSPHSEAYGLEVTHDPRSGYQHMHDILVAPTYYLRLKQMVADKVNASRRARRDALTGQPVRGRAEAGAIRLGEMERDAILANGMATFLNESLTTRSDGVSIPGSAFVNGQYTVPSGDDGTLAQREYSSIVDTTTVKSGHPPRSFTLMQGELLGLGIALDAFGETFNHDT